MQILSINTGANGWLRSDQPDTVQDASTALTIGILLGTNKRRPLLSFSIAALPSAAQIITAVVGMRQNSAAGWSATARLLSADWTASAATWNRRMAGVTWTTPGGDYAASPSSVFATSSLANKSTGIECSALLGAARAAGRTSLDLILMKTDESGANAVTTFMAFGQTHPPTLVIEYELPVTRGAKLALGMGVGL